MKIHPDHRHHFVGWGMAPARARVASPAGKQGIGGFIASELAANPAALRLSRALLARDIADRFRVNRLTAYRAIDKARGVGR